MIIETVVYLFIWYWNGCISFY